ncbi:MAG TPA: hypothetical protein EYP53_07850 [Candidatus Latescibacteria bacterium]|nr:hypothetical protein [Candidatus Latescibacterota bacterium]
MESLWEKIKKGVRDGLSATVEKTDELTRTGKLKLDISAIRRDINRNFTELGRVVYRMISEEKAEEITTDQEVISLVEKINALQLGLKQKEEELREIREKKGEEEEAGPAK